MCLLPGGFTNTVTGLGVPGVDPAASLAYRTGRIPSAMLVDNLYTHNWLAARIIEKMPSVALVRGVTGVPDDVWDRYMELSVTDRFPGGAFERGVFDGRAYGGGELLLGYDRGDPASPLMPAEAAGGINFLDWFAQHELRVVSRFADPSQANFGMPEVYEVINGSNGPLHPRLGQKFHTSRSIRFSGNPLRVPYFNTDLTGDGPEVGVSVLTPVLTTIGQYDLAWSAVSNLLQDASIGVMKMAGLVEGLASEAESVIQDRMQTLQMTKSVHRMLFLDADAAEEYTRTEVKLTDVPQVMQQIMLSVAAAANTPAGIFFNSSPTGLNANSKGEAELVQFYSLCQDYRLRYLGPRLNRLLTAVNGGVAVKVEWPSLWDASENELAQTRLAMANADKMYWDIGFGAKDIGKARAEGTVVELAGAAPEDGRDEVAGAGQPEVPPQGAPGKQGAAKIAKKQRAEEKK